MNTNDEITIDLLDIAKRLLRNWKKVLLVALVFAFICNCFFVYKEYSKSKKVWESLQELKKSIPEATYSIAESALDLIPDKNQYDTSKITNVVNALTRYDSYNEEINTIKENIEKSYFLKLDKTVVPTIDSYYFISVDSSDWDNITKAQRVADVSTIIKNYLTSEEVINDLLSSLSLDLDPILFKELISIWTSNDILTIRVYGQSREECENISNHFQSIIEKSMPRLSNSIKGVNFSVSFIGNNYIESNGDMVISAQNSYYDSIASLDKKIDEIGKALSSDEKNLYNDILTVRYVTEHGTPEEIEEYYTHKNHIYSLKGIAIGFILGGFIYCAWFLYDYLRGNKLRVPYDIPQRYGLSDCKSEENILSLMKKKEFSKLAVLGAGKDKISIPSVPLVDADCAVIAEIIDVTCMKDVAEEISQCNQYEVPILGYVLVEK